MPNKPKLLMAAFACCCLFIQAADSASASVREPDLTASLVNEPGAVMFTPPKGWRYADNDQLPKSVKVMVVGKGQHEYPPTINLGTERYTGTLKQYLKIVKEINDSQGAEWKNLGSIRTQAGNGSLSQVDAKTEWGNVRMMHVILIKNGIVYIMTAAAFKDEFPKFYKDFFNAMRSLRINKDAFEMVSNPAKRAMLEKEAAEIKKGWNELYAKQRKNSPEMPEEALSSQVFASEEFQKKYWEPFKALLEKDFNDMGASWQGFALDRVQKELQN